MSHTCHAPDCNRIVPARMFACKFHWYKLPKKIQDAIWDEYRNGQEITKRPTFRYMAVQRLACAYLVFEPHSEKAVRKALPYLAEAIRYQKAAIEAGLGDPLENLIPKEWPTKESLEKAATRPAARLGKPPVKKARGRAKTL